MRGERESELFAIADKESNETMQSKKKKREVEKCKTPHRTIGGRRKKY